MLAIMVGFTTLALWLLAHALDIDPETDDFLLTTNRGFFRIGRESGRVRPIQGASARAASRRRSAPSSSWRSPARAS